VPKGIITLIDMGTGLQTKAEIDGPYNAKDNAHQHVRMVLEFLEELSKPPVPATEPLGPQESALREALESATDALTAAMRFARPDAPRMLWEVLAGAKAEIAKALEAPEVAAEPVDMAHRIVGANGLVLG